MERVQRGRARAPELQQAKMELVAAHECGDGRLMSRVAKGDAVHREALTDFVAGLYATELTEEESALQVAPEIAALTQRAIQRALAAVFAAAPAALAGTLAPAVAARAPSVSLAQARRAAGLGLVDLARRLKLGADVMQKLEQGQLIAASLPQKLVERLAEAVRMTTAQVWELLRMPPAMQAQPALRRQRPVGKLPPEGQMPEPQTFAEALKYSPSMTAEERAAWLNEGVAE